MSLFDEMMQEQSEYEKAIEELKEEVNKLREENEQLKVNEEILMKIKGCLNEDNSTNCRVLESLNYGIRAYEKTLKNSIPISVIQEKLNKDKKEFDKMKKEKPSKIKELIINQKYARIMAFKELLEEGKK